MAKGKNQGIRNRIKDHRRVKASELVPHPQNWREHPDEQRAALVGLYQEVGFARSLLAYELPDGRLQLLDGHLRRDIDPEMEVEVEVLDVTEEEARKLLATIDPLSAMADANGEQLDKLLAEVESENPDVQAMLHQLAAENGVGDESEVQLKKLDVKPPPKMTWVLLGIETVRFGEIAELVQQAAQLPGAICETSVSDEPEAKR